MRQSLGGVVVAAGRVLGGLAVAVLVLTGALSVVAISASTARAAEVEEVGKPLDRFADRRRIGQEGIAVLYHRNTANLTESADDHYRPALRFLRLSPNLDSQKRVSGVGGASVAQGHPSGMADADRNRVPAAITRATLSTRTIAGEPRPDGAEGIVIAGVGLSSGGACGAAELCVGYIAPKYGADHKLSGVQAFFRGLGVNPGVGQDVEVAVGTFAPSDGPSIVVSTVAGTAGAGTAVLHHVKVERGGTGDVTGLRPAFATTIATTLAANDVSLAVGDLAGDGVDRLAVVGLVPSPFLRRAIAIGVLRAGSDGRFTADPPPAGSASNPPLTTVKDGDTTHVQQASAGTPAAAVLRSEPRPIVAGENGRKDALVITSAHSEIPVLVDWSPGTEPALRGPECPSGGPFCYSGGGSSSVPERQLVPVGDVDANGVEDLAVVGGAFGLILWAGGRKETSQGPVTTLEHRANPSRALEWFPEANESLVSMALVGLDSRSATDQAIVPSPTNPHLGAKQLYLVRRIRTTVGPPNPATSEHTEVAALRIDPGPASLWQVETLSPTYSSPPNTDAFVTGGAEAVPLALDGHAEIAEPRKESLTRIDPLVILNAPPTHFDILNGRQYDPNFCYAGNQYAVPPVCFFESKYERTASSELQVVSETTHDWAVTQETSVGGQVGIANVKGTLETTYGQNYKNTGLTSKTQDVTVQVIARNSDKIYALTRVYDLLEYPYFQPGADEPDGHLLAVAPHTVSRRWIDSNSPLAESYNQVHQPGNILSYPSQVPTTATGFIAPPSPDDPLGPDDPAPPATFAHDEFELSDSSDYQYTLTRGRVQEDAASLTHKWGVTATLEVGFSVFDVGIDASLKGEYSGTSMKTSTTKLGEKTSLTSRLGGIDESFGETAYTVKPFSYYTHDGALVLDYAVEPGVGGSGPPTFWDINYGRKPDLTLTLPRLRDYEAQAGISSDAARFISPGVEITSAGSSGDCVTPLPLPDGLLDLDRNLCVHVAVRNYSLKSAPGSTVRFYEGDPDAGGALIGQTHVGAIEPRGTRTVGIPWNPGARVAGTNLRIFAVVDGLDGVAEIHEDNNKGFRTVAFKSSATATLAPPVDVLAEADGDDGLLVSWTEPVQPRPAGSRWLVQAMREGGGVHKQVVGGGASSATFDGLPAGRYRAVVSSIPSGSETPRSPVSHPSEPVDLAPGAPGQPSFVTAEARPRSAIVRWTAPSYTGTSPLTGFRVREYRDAGDPRSEPLAEITVGAEAREAAVPGLVNGREYRFTVEALNAAGPGAESAPTTPVVPADVPGAPTSVTAEASSDGTATVRWTPPADTGGSPITGYTITASPGGRTVDVPDGVSTDAPMSGLALGTSYTFTVKARNAVGTGPASVPSAPVTPASVPAGVRSLRAGALDGAIEVSWLPPENDGGKPVHTYRLDVRSSAGDRTTFLEASRRSARIERLQNGTAYSVSVTAVNDVGDGAEETISGLVPTGPPADAPTTPREDDPGSPPSVRFTEVPREGSTTGDRVLIGFEVAPAGARVTCIIDERATPCASPFTVTGLSHGQHSIRIVVETPHGAATTDTLTWFVDARGPSLGRPDFRSEVIRNSTALIELRGRDREGSRIAGYEVRARRATMDGAFESTFVREELRGGSRARYRPRLEPGQTACLAFRARDSVGNVSRWSRETCIARALDDRELRRRGRWGTVRLRGLLGRRAAQTRSRGASMSVAAGKLSSLTVLTRRCRSCGTLRVKVGRRTVRVIRLGHRGRARLRSLRISKRSRGGTIRLIATGRGRVLVDGIAVVRRP